jgi:hypothetical protein
MHKATITYRSPISGVHSSVVTDDNITLFYAQIVGTVQGATAAGSVILAIDIEKEVQA